SYTSAYFASSGTDAGPLHALPSGSGGNGVFAYGTSVFPTNSFNATNYWVDVVFSQILIQATTTTLTSTLNPSTLGQPVTFTARVSAGGSGTPTGTVTFMEGTTTLGTGTLDAAGLATFSTSAMTVGNHAITAVYGGGGSFSPSTSSALGQ